MRCGEFIVVGGNGVACIEAASLPETAVRSLPPKGMIGEVRCRNGNAWNNEGAADGSRKLRTGTCTECWWYWRLDAGGPHMRDLRPGHPDGAFLFPQMTAGAPHDREKDGSLWSPQFVDYLFLAFNTSTAISPTDTPVISRWAKVLMMIQSLISLTVIAILVGRAINIL